MQRTTPRRVLITGGASGFGLAIAGEVLQEGWQAALVDLDGEALDDARALLGDDVSIVQADVRDPRDVRAAVRAAADQMNGLDSVVLSAGVLTIQPAEEVTEEQWDRTLDVNLKGAFFTVQAALPWLRDCGRGRVVAISSDAGRRGFASVQAYTASKFGLVGVMESLAAELAADAVTVNTLCPVGCPTTSMGRALVDLKARQTNRAPSEITRLTAGTNPIGRNATEADIANAAMFFLHDSASFLTGVTIDVDGGAHLGSIPGASDE